MADATSIKYLKLRQSLRKFIKSHHPGTKLPTYAEIIRRYGVSQATVDLALRDFDEQKLIVRKSKRGIYVSPRAAQKNIGVIFGHNIFSSEISPVSRLLLKYAEEHATQNRENVSFFINTRQVMIEGHDIRVNRDLVDVLESGRLDGLLLIGSRGPAETKWLGSQDIPLVVLSNRPGSAYGIAFDTGELVRLGTEALVARGCERIALLSNHGHQRDQDFFDDIEAYGQVLNHHKLDRRPEWIWDKAPKPPIDSIELPVSNEELGKIAAEALFGGNPDPENLPFDGVVSTDDMLTRGFLGKLCEAGIYPETHIKISTHVNKGLPVLREYGNSLNLIEVDPEKLVDEAFAVLRKLSSGELTAPGLSLITPCFRMELCGVGDE